VDVHLFPELAVARWYDALRPSVAVMNGLKGVLQFAITLIFLGAISIVVILPICTLVSHDTGLPGFHEFINASAWLICAATAVVLTPVAIVLCLNKLACRDDQGQPVSRKALTTRLRRWYGKSLLRSYRLSRSLLHHYSLEKFLSDLFDPNYYGRSDRGRVWEESLKTPDANQNGPTCANRNGPTECAEVDVLFVVGRRRRLPVFEAVQPSGAGAGLSQVEGSVTVGGWLGVRNEGPSMRMVMQWCWSRSRRASTRGLLRNSSYHWS